MGGESKKRKQPGLRHCANRTVLETTGAGKVLGRAAAEKNRDANGRQTAAVRSPAGFTARVTSGAGSQEQCPGWIWSSHWGAVLCPLVGTVRMHTAAPGLPRGRAAVGEL